MRDASVSAVGHDDCATRNETQKIQTPTAIRYERRYMARHTFLIALLFVVSSCLGTLDQGKAKTESDQRLWPYQDAAPQEETGQIQYINQEIPNVSLPPSAGETYEDRVPDTYDIAERCRLAINVLTAATNRNQDHEQYFSCYIGNPLRMSHNFSDWCTPKYTEALALLRPITGSSLNQSVDRIWKEVILKSIGPDGLYYFPIVGKPWYGKELWWSNGVARADGSIFQLPEKTEVQKQKEIEDVDTYAQPHADSLVEQSGIRQFSHPQPCGRVLNILCIHYMRDGNPIWKDTIERMIDRLLELAVRKDDYCYFPALYFEPGAKFDPDDPRAAAPQGIQGGEINGRCIKGPALYYQLTGYEPARELAQKLTNFMRHHDGYFGPDGEFLAEQHYHAHTNYLFQMLQLAMATDNEELLRFVQKSFEWAKSSEHGMSTLTGHTNEFARPYPRSEGCAVADMVALALKLSHAGAADYYEDAERWTRNFFDEMQLTQLVRWGRTMQPKKVRYNETTDRVAERTIGAFASWASGNEFLIGDERGTENLIMHCCTGNSTRTLYYIWRHILDYDEGTLRVNMLLNRASPWADIYSHVPYQGQVDVKLKQPCQQLLVHAPEWIETGSDDLSVTCSGKRRTIAWKDRYLDLGSFEPGETVEITFLISERTEKERMGEKDFTLVIKGNTVVSVDPPGKHCPLFNREHYRASETRWREVERFVPEESLHY